MPLVSKTQPPSFDHFIAFLKQNPSTDFSAINWDDPQIDSTLNWKGLTKYKDDLLKLLKAYQRLRQLLPPENHELILSLLKENINSAIQIASIPKANFFTAFSDLFGHDNQLMESCYSKATAIRTRLLLQQMQMMQSNNTGLL